MKAEVCLDSAVFQLTPTRTRYDLVIIANGKKEKIASGLLKPFLEHLKIAQDQIAKGGYSIVLEPDPETEAAWFTKGTVERFVRFVNNPDVLERVSTIESEILQTENAIAIQSNDNIGLSTVEERHSKQAEYSVGGKATVGADAERAIVLYTAEPQTQALESNGSAKQEENSKVQLLRVLETRKCALRKEQGMAFARAVAAGFAMDNMSPLISFAESFGAARLMQACTRFMDLWKKKHETGQWVDVEAMEVQSEFSYVNGSGIMLATDSLKQKEAGEAWPSPNGDVTLDSNGKEKQIPSDAKAPLGHPEYFPVQFQHPSYAQWAMHSPAGAPFQPFPIPGMPYYPNYPGSVPYYHHPYPTPDDPRSSTPLKVGSRRHSMENRESNNDSEAWERSTRSHDGTDENISDVEKESSHGHSKAGRSGKKKSGVVVIQNLNYIASKKHGASGSDSQSASDAESEEEAGLNSNSREKKHKQSHKGSRKDEDKSKSFGNSYGKEDAYEPEADAGNWQVFQNFLLKAEEKNRAADGDLFSGEKGVASKRKQNKNEFDPLAQPGQEDLHEQQGTGFDRFGGAVGRMKQTASGDEMIALSDGRGPTHNQFKEIADGRGGYRKMTSEEFVIYGRDKHLSGRHSSDPLADGLYESGGNADKKSSKIPRDESFMLSYRSASQDHPDGRSAIDIDSEISRPRGKAQDSRNGGNVRIKYEPDGHLLVPQRGSENVSSSYDPAMENFMHIPAKNSPKPSAKKETITSKNAKNELKKSDKDVKSRLSQDSLEKKRKEALMKRGVPSRSNPSVEAQLRAEKLRSYKADMQKLKKEKEDEELKRLEALKKERQKRIAARSSSVVKKSPQTIEQQKTRVATKFSPSVIRSKFSDSEPRSSPLTKLPTRTTSLGSAESKAKSSRLSALSGITRSISSLPDVKKDRNGLLSEAKVASLRSKRLSDPQGSSTQRASLKSVTRLSDPRGSSTQRASSLKPLTKIQAPKKIPDESQKRKISAIMQLDQRKSATLPELKIRTQKSLSDIVMKQSSTKEAQPKRAENRFSHDKTQANSSTEKPRRLNNGEDNHVMEKTVLTIESNFSSAKVQPGNGKERVNRDGPGSEYARNHRPPSPVSLVNTVDVKVDNRLNSYEAIVNHSKAEAQKLPSETATEKPYQAPFARLTSLEEPVKREYYQAPYARATSLEDSAGISLDYDRLKTITETEVSSAHAEGEKPSKESKGFRKLLKFGRKNNDSDTHVDEHSVTAASSSDAPTLKNLISQDDAHAGGTPIKVSRPFALLSPFRSKNTEKKVAG